MKRIVIAALLSVLLATPATAEKLTVMLDWFVNPDHGPLFVALERGEFSKRGLDVELIAPADPNDPPKLVAAGRGDVAISYQPQLHLQVDAGLPLKRVGNTRGDAAVFACCTRRWTCEIHSGSEGPQGRFFRGWF